MKKTSMENGKTELGSLEGLLAKIYKSAEDLYKLSNSGKTSEKMAVEENQIFSQLQASVEIFLQYNPGQTKAIKSALEARIDKFSSETVKNQLRKVVNHLFPN